MSEDAIRLIALDFDLTIFDYANPSETRVVLPALAALASRGVRVGIASGRSVANLRIETATIGMEWANPFPDFVIEHECLIRTPEGADFPGTEDWNADVVAGTAELVHLALPLLERVRARAIAEGTAIVREILAEPGSVSICLESPAATERARVALSAELAGGFDGLEVRRNHHILMLARAGQNKGAALAELQRALDLGSRQILAIGDNLNDLSMMTAELGFQCATVGNADPSVIQAVQARGGRVATGRVAHGLNELFHTIFSTELPLEAASPRFASR